MLKFRNVAFLLIAAINVPASATTLSNSDATAVPTQNQLSLLSDFFLPKKITKQAIVGGCSVALRAVLEKGQGSAEVQTAFPGIFDTLISASSSYAEKNADDAINAVHRQVEKDWLLKLSPHELNELTSLFAQAMKETNNMELDFQKGDMATDALNRIDKKQFDYAAFQQAQLRYANTPRRIDIISDVVAYQKNLTTMTQSSDGLYVSIVQGCKKAGFQVANQMVREKYPRYAPPYPE